MAVVRLEAAHTAPEPFRGTSAFAAGLLITFVFWGVTAWALIRIVMVLLDPNALTN
jgi:choline-glycine betaine transporter